MDANWIFIKMFMILDDSRKKIKNIVKAERKVMNRNLLGRIRMFHCTSVSDHNPS